MDLELRMLTAAREIGGVVGCNNHFTYRLARAVAATGKAFEDLTIQEFLVLIEEESVAYNALFLPRH